jgi:hypothetical protein
MHGEQKVKLIAYHVPMFIGCEVRLSVEAACFQHLL